MLQASTGQTEQTETEKERARWQLHKNARSYIEQILEVTPHVTKHMYGHLPPISKIIQVNE